MSETPHDGDEYALVLDHRDWEVHFWRWDFNELAAATDPGALLSWLPDEILDGTVLPARRTLREQLELVRNEHARIVRQPQARLDAAFEQKLTPEQLRRKYDPLSGKWSYGNPYDEAAALRGAAAPEATEREEP